MISPYALLILPSPPTPATAETVEVAYGKAVGAALKQTLSLARNASLPGSLRLDVAIATPTSRAPKTSRFHHWQSVVAHVYEVICSKSAELSIDLDTESGLDVRIFITDTFIRGVHPEVPDEDSSTHVKQGPIIDLPTLAYSGRKYSVIFAVEGEEGEDVLQKFLHLLPTYEGNIKRIPGGTVLHHSKPGGPGRHVAPGSGSVADLSHKSVAVGGTFDHLHIGHKLLLFGTALATTTKGDRAITIGITGDELLKNKKYAEVMEDWDTRQERVADFIESILLFSPSETIPRVELGNEPGPNGKFVKRIFQSGITINYVQISDPFGPTITDESITALVISAETRSGGAAVNSKREEKSWKALEILEISVLDIQGAQQASQQLNPEDFKNKISSTAIRQRIIEKSETNQ